MGGVSLVDPKEFLASFRLYWPAQILARHAEEIIKFTVSPRTAVATNHHQQRYAEHRPAQAISSTFHPILALVLVHIQIIHTATANSAQLLFIINPAPSNQLYIDNVSVKDSSGTQLLVNHDFSSSITTGWSVFCACSGGGDGGYQASVGCYGGTGTCYYDDCSGSWHYLAQSISTVANAVYTIGFSLASNPVGSTKYGMGSSSQDALIYVKMN
ncbi:unnamed protein product [Didymodactylos carnosus]|uniref:Uncharacterized protein n=1 Tax=Didymodactylos carnosus TaxID=1234261 RepID=A0A815I766_9BILA|nr:unnamed protein product [Didymodactylos carnosus]CAF4245420.1 unnamed protein product [Didymodactylos carnosus]